MKKYLILGATSLIGKRLVTILLEQGEKVYAASKRNVFSGEVCYIPWDMYDFDNVDKNFYANEFDCVVVAAWDGNGRNERNNPEKNQRCSSALQKWISLISQNSNIKQVVLLGSQAECGAIDELSAYGKSKLELFTNISKEIDNLTELRFHTVFGYTDYKDQMLQNVMGKLISDEDVSFYSDGNQTYDFLYVDDAANAIITACNNGTFGVYNVSANSNLTFKEYMSTVKSVVGGTGSIVYGDEATLSLEFNSDLFRNKTGWKCINSFEESINKMKYDIVYDSLKSKDVIVYGAGYCGLMFSELLVQNSINPLCFFDKSIEKKDKTFNSIPVKTPSENKNPNSVIILAILNTSIFSDIEKYLKTLGYSRIYNIYDFKNVKELFEKQQLIFYSPFGFKEKNEKDINTVLSLLSDQASKEIYSAIIENLDRKHQTIPALSMHEQYFAYDVYKKNPDEVFADCGAFRGDILKCFSKNNQFCFKEYYAIEPDPSNYKRIEELEEAKDSRVKVIKVALSNRHEQLKMENYLNENSVIRNEGFPVIAHTFNEICVTNKIKPTFIKVDLEGYESKFLDGAVQTIRQYKPLMAIAIYHKPNDFFEIPKRIHELLPDHKLFVRSYLNVNETILYAVPKERLLDEIY